MNKQNVIIEESGGMLRAEWSDRAPDDEDRYSDDSIFITVEVPVEEGMGSLWARMYEAMDRWIKERT